jgi:hypothetical protein
MLPPQPVIFQRRKNPYIFPNAPVSSKKAVRSDSESQEKLQSFYKTSKFKKFFSIKKKRTIRAKKY